MLLLDLYESTKTHTQLLAEAILEAVEAAKKDMPLGWKHLQRFLSPQERDKMRRDVAERMLDIFRRLPSEKEFEAAALAGKAKKGWYAASAKALMEVFGADTPRFAALLASLSPQVSVIENLRNSVRFWEAWISAGRPTNPKDIDEVGVSVLGEPRWLGTTVIDPETKKPVHKAGMGWRKNVLKAITQPQPEQIVLSSGGTENNPTMGKVDSFRANLLGDLSRVTNDAWMAHFADIDQALFASKAGYLAMSARIRKVAVKMGWEPAEVQETVWSFFKALKESQTPESKGREAMKKLSHQDVNDSKNFADLMSQDTEVRDALQRLRDRGFTHEASQSLRSGGPDSTGSPYESGAQAGLAGDLNRIADRARDLSHREDCQELSTRGFTFTKAKDLRLTGTTATFVITDPRELKELQEKKPEQEHVIVGRRDGKWEILYSAKLMFAEDAEGGKKLKFHYAGSKTIKPAEIDPDRWRWVKVKNAERAARHAQGVPRGTATPVASGANPSPSDSERVLGVGA